MATNIVYWLLVVSSGFYFLVMLVLTIGWFRTKRFNGELIKPFIPVSIVVAVRNEEINILKLLRSLAQQDYPESNFEVIIVDDHSEDDTKKVVEDFIMLNNTLKIRLIDATGEGKKKAISQAISVSKGQLIISTDGDCEMGNQWLSRLVAFYQEARSSMIIAPVVYHESNRLLSNIFSLEFMSLVASGAGSAGIGLPFMGNGANLAFSKDVFNSKGQNIGERYASGEDVFLIQQVLKNKGSRHIQFLKDTESIVHTSAPESFSAFFNQRFRWASKAKGYQSLWGIFVAFVVFYFNTMLATTLIMGISETWLIIVFILFVVFKLLIDIPLLYEFTGFVNRRKLMYLLPLLEFIYPFYISVSSLVGLFFKYEWKGRKGLR